MAVQIIRVVDSIGASPAPRRKALVIMNYRHAFGNRFEYPVGRKPANTGRFLFDRYGGRIANVYVSWLALAFADSGNDVDLRLIHDGRWDAAFRSLGLEDLGFDFTGSPFGRDSFDIWPRRDHPFTFSDVFTGFVFWLPVEKHRAVVGIPGFIDSSFAGEYLRRFRIFSTALGRRSDFTIGELAKDANERRIFTTDNLDALVRQRDRWLK
jgi:hypothetical protein